MAAPTKTPEIQRDEVVLGKTLGVGSFGKVIRGKCRGKDVAIKMLHKTTLDEKTLVSFKKEVAIMSTLFHPNICLFMGACTKPGNFFIVTEYLEAGDVEKLLRNKSIRISLYRRMQMARDAALGMNWLHCSRPVFIHRDLKSSNLLIDDSGKVKVCDFGLSQVKDARAMLRDEDLAKGTPLWMAPEVMQFKEFNEKADVYSYGIVLWEFVARKEPFSHHTNYSKFKRAVCENNERPPIPESTESSLRYLITRCWDASPPKRPSFKQIIAQLDHVLVDVAVGDRIGRKFWKDEFLTHSEVPYDVFGEKFCDLLRLNVEGSNPDIIRLNLECLKALLSKPPASKTDTTLTEVVNLEHFGKILEWFGPIEDPSTNSGETILDYMRQLLKYPWFHGDLNERKAQERLSGKPGGTFLVRFSSMAGWFTLSQITATRVIQHRRIRHRPGHGFMVDEDRYNSLAELVIGRKLTLPCEGSRFAHLFEVNTPHIQGYVSVDY
eukprot:TRINITY_DN7496_c0_g1_i1.p1 TRINITY_DN7496_c0_g1~~TRINITY_DN7496_c0_g1_i1.p1  ORF type:complete len:493 (-),score=71.45 TRINITY_DN7496_c0_g1_i1:286-1764(-)